MLKALGVALLGSVSVCAFACSGKEVAGDARGAAGSFGGGALGGATAGAGTSNGGSGASGGSTIGDGGPPTQACSGDDEILCAASCGSAQFEFVHGECRGGQWTCSASFIDPQSCAPDSCLLQLADCCDHEYGKRSQPPCGSNGRFGPCPSGLERNAEVCVADSAHTTDCSTLFDKSCTLEAALCERQGVHCQCAPDDGGLTWHCAVDLL